MEKIVTCYYDENDRIIKEVTEYVREEDAMKYEPLFRLEEQQEETTETLKEVLSNFTEDTGFDFNVEDGTITVFEGECYIGESLKNVSEGGQVALNFDKDEREEIEAVPQHADELLVDNERLVDQINGLKARIGVLESDIALLKAEESNYINVWSIVDGKPMLVQKINKTDSEEQDDENL